MRLRPAIRLIAVAGAFFVVIPIFRVLGLYSLRCRRHNEDSETAGELPRGLVQRSR